VVDSLVSMGGHAYRKDIRQGTYRFLNLHLKNDPRPVQDSEIDLVTGPREEIHPLPPEQLRVFPQDSDIPKDALNGRIDQEFVPIAKLELPKEGAFASWKNELLAKLRRMTFHHFPERIPPAQKLGEEISPNLIRLATEPGIAIRLRAVRIPATRAGRIFVVVTSLDVNAAVPAWLEGFAKEQDAVYVCEPRGVGASQWTGKNPPNYVARSHYLLGRTVDGGRVWDVAATARYLRDLHKQQAPVHLVGETHSAVLAVYAALLEPDISGLILREPPGTHQGESAPSLLNVLRVCDVPEALGMLAPRPVTLLGGAMPWVQKAAAIYRAAGAADQLVLKK